MSSPNPRPTTEAGCAGCLLAFALGVIGAGAALLLALGGLAEYLRP